MDEELNENDLEERLYAMIHHVDGTQAEENVEQSYDAGSRVQEAPRSTLKRYWRTSHNSSYQKVNTPKDAPTNRNTPTNNKNAPANINKCTPAPVNTSHAAATVADSKPKEEKDAPNSPTSALAILQTTRPQNFTKTVEILEFDETAVFELESSDEDEVVEIALPPKPTITIESSDDDDEPIIETNKNTNNKVKSNSKENKSPNKSNRDISASPVPSVQSSMSDDFIRGDCIALNISSAQPDSQSFDFSLHGSDLIEECTPSKKKKKKRSKVRLTSTPIAEEVILNQNNTDNIFATPKSKAKKKKPKTKSYTVSEKIIPNPDVYDSDSNQSVIDVSKNHDAYTVTEKSFPSTDVYESDSSVSESIRDVGKQTTPQRKANVNDSSDSNTSMELQTNTIATDKTLVIDLTNDYKTLDTTEIEENIVIGNISGYSDIHEHGDSFENRTPEKIGEFCSTKVPQILYEDLDFDNLKGKDKVCTRRRYSLTTLRAEMEKFYNESWGGENFNHQEILKNMSRDKSLWVIDPKDRMPNPPKRRVTCNYCNRIGHRDDTCRLKPPVCHMCGRTGHYEPRCPRKLCVNCGSPNFMYSTSCRNCARWRQLTCAECGQPGHPASHCPDTWRRYHNTIDENMPFEQCGEKPPQQLQCSGCARRGHLAHACRAFLPLCPLALPAPRVQRYRRLYPPPPPPPPPRQDARKRHSKSPTAHDGHVNKRRNVSESDAWRKTPENRKNSDSERRKNSESDNRIRKMSQTQTGEAKAKSAELDKAPEFISDPVDPNTDSMGRVIQDTEVSNTSEVETSARIYLAFDMMQRLSSPAEKEWLSQSMARFNVSVQYEEACPFLTVVGTIGDQEAFHAELRSRCGRPEAIAPESENVEPKTQFNVMPKKKKDVLRKLNNAFDSLKTVIGDPKAIFKELTYLQNRHKTIRSQKVVSPLQLQNNRDNMNEMLKKLNMVLLGQAGLAGGAERLNTLYSLQEKLVNIRNQRVPNPLRSEISQHYQIIFTPLPRNDYANLVQKFYTMPSPALDNGSPGKNKKKRKKKVYQQKITELREAHQNQPMTVIQKQSGEPKSRFFKDMTKKLSWFYSRLQKKRPDNEASDAKRLRIANKILKTKNCLTNESQGETKKQKMVKIKTAWKIHREAKEFLDGEKLRKKKNILVLNKV